MADYHFAAKLVCRSKGQSVVAAAAYRAGIILEDERLGKTFDYTRRRGVQHTEIRTPANTPEGMQDRARLWNTAEKVEKRKDSQIARSLDIALPHELSLGLNLELVRGFIDEQYVNRGMIADFAIHAPSRKGDIRNVHVHILLTTRELTPQGFGAKVRDWNDKKELLEWRKAWADHANRILEREGFEERIDHRSLSDQGIDREPTTHVGPNVNEMERRGIPTDKGEQNRQIKASNDNIDLLKNELAGIEERLAELKQQQAAERAGRMQRIQKTVRAADAIWEQAEPRQAQPPPEPEPPAAARAPELIAPILELPVPTLGRPAEPEPPPAPPTPERAPEPAPPAAQQPELPAPTTKRRAEPPEPEHVEEPKPPASVQQPELPPATPRRRSPSRYAELIGQQKYDERAKEDEQKQDSGREREKEEQERERKPDRDR
jgi:hypothetical protein